MENTSTKRQSYRTRTRITHRFLHYIQNGTSAKHPEWRDETIRFFYQLFELMDENPGLNVIIRRDDGLSIYIGKEPIVYIHFRQQHFLLHARPEYKVSDDGDRLFGTSQEGSWPKMWRIGNTEKCSNLLDFLAAQPKLTLDTDVKHTRSIPAWVKEFVFERDGGKCVVEGCGSTKDLCFDHILPFSKGGSSVHPDNLQILCSKHNLAKGATFTNEG